MIDKFFIQTNDTVLDFMSEIAKSKEVFSTFSGREIDNYTTTQSVSMQLKQK